MVRGHWNERERRNFWSFHGYFLPIRCLCCVFRESSDLDNFVCGGFQDCFLFADFKEDYILKKYFFLFRTIPAIILAKRDLQPPRNRNKMARLLEIQSDIFKFEAATRRGICLISLDISLNLERKNIMHWLCFLILVGNCTWDTSGFILSVIVSQNLNICKGSR